MGDSSAMTLCSLPAAAPACSTPEGWSRDTSRLSPNPFPSRRGGSVPAERRAQFPALTCSLPAPISDPPRRRQGRRAGRHQRPRILLPAANKTYLSLPSHSPWPLSGGTEQKDPPWPSPSIAARRDRVTRWTLGSQRSLLCGSLVSP